MMTFLKCVFGQCKYVGSQLCELEYKTKFEEITITKVCSVYMSAIAWL